MWINSEKPERKANEQVKFQTAWRQYSCQSKEGIVLPSNVIRQVLEERNQLISLTETVKRALNLISHQNQVFQNRAEFIKSVSVCNSVVSRTDQTSYRRKLSSEMW